MNAPPEEWRDIAGYEGLYQVSSLGRVRSLDRVIERPPQGGYLKPGRILAGRIDAYGYRILDLFAEKSRFTAKVHRLVAAAFLVNPEGKNEVDHRNGNRAENHVVNLRWATSTENKYNRHQTSARSGIPGVRNRGRGGKNPYQAYVNIKGRFKSLGCYPTPGAAECARQEYFERNINGSF